MSVTVGRGNTAVSVQRVCQPVCALGVLLGTSVRVPMRMSLWAQTHAPVGVCVCMCVCVRVDGRVERVTLQVSGPPQPRHSQAEPRAPVRPARPRLPPEDWPSPQVSLMTL